MDEAPVESKDDLRSVHPVLPWQYSELEDEWGEIVGHGANPDCPCAEGGENCLRKHGKRIVKLSGETMMMDTNPERRALLAYWKAAAGDLVKRSELMVWSLGAKLPVDVDWARVQKKAAELILRKNAQLSLIDRMKVHYAERQVKSAIHEVARDTQKDINMRLERAGYLPKPKGDTTMAIDGTSMKNRAAGQILGRFVRLSAKYYGANHLDAINAARAKATPAQAPLTPDQLGLMDNYDALATLGGGVAALGLYAMQGKASIAAHPSLEEIGVEAGLHLASYSIDMVYEKLPLLFQTVEGGLSDTFKVRTIDIQNARASAARMQGGAPGGASRKSANVEQLV